MDSNQLPLGENLYRCGQRSPARRKEANAVFLRILLNVLNPMRRVGFAEGMEGGGAMRRDATVLSAMGDTDG